ncbi:hypothetical protein, partial [Arhodomonas sp. AD133]|uniref:hypothetical protein n=1 Tax=Arhodomonas sp. AD133 TaxID=3415009 RepID=UPI003EC13A0E
MAGSRGRRFGAWTLVFVALALLAVETASALYAPISGGQRVKAGVVAARGTITGPNGAPIWVAYDEQGAVVEVIGEAVGELADAEVMAGSAYRLHWAGYQRYLDEHDLDPG